METSLVGLRGEHVGWRLLRADHAEVVISVVDRVFISPQRLSVAEDDVLSAVVSVVGECDDLVRPARQYWREWLDAGYFHRRLVVGSDDAVISVPVDVISAVSWVLGECQSVDADEVVPTGGSVAMMSALLTQLHGADDGGEVVTDEQVVDRSRALVQVAEQLLVDCRYVEERVHRVDREFREQMMQFTGPRADVVEWLLGEQFSVESSAQGQSFVEFFDVVFSQEFSNAVHEVAQRVVVAGGDGDALLSVVRKLRSAAADVMTVMRVVSAKLRTFVEQEDDQRYRSLVMMLRQVESSCQQVSGTPMEESWVMSVELPMVDVLAMDRMPWAGTAADEPAGEVQHAAAAVDAAAELASVFAADDDDYDSAMAHLLTKFVGTGSVADALLSSGEPVNGLADVVAAVGMAVDAFGVTKTADEYDLVTVHEPDSSHRQRTVRLPRLLLARAPDTAADDADNDYVDDHAEVSV